MKTTIQLDIEISDAFLDKWNTGMLGFFMDSCNNDNEALKKVKENSYEKTLASWIERQINDYHQNSIKSCKASIIKIDTDSE